MAETKFKIDIRWLTLKPTCYLTLRFMWSRMKTEKERRIEKCVQCSTM